MGAMFSSRLLRMCRRSPKGVLASSNGIAFEDGSVAALSLRDDSKVAVVCYQQLTVGAQVLGDLLAFHRVRQTLSQPLDFHCAPVWRFNSKVNRLCIHAPAKLVLREQSSVGLPSPTILELKDWFHPRLQGFANLDEECLDCRVVGCLIGRVTRRANLGQFGQVGCYRVHYSVLQEAVVLLKENESSDARLHITFHPAPSGLKIMPSLVLPFITATSGDGNCKCRTQPCSSTAGWSASHCQSTKPSPASGLTVK